jgi:hypothetical protein
VLGYGIGVEAHLFPVLASTSFGPMAQGCSAGTRPVEFTNDGLDPLVVDTVFIEPLDAPFELSPAPQLPATIPPGGTFTVQVRALTPVMATYTGKVGATTTTSNTARVDLQLEVAAAGTMVTQTFITPDTIKADILFVIDDSGSMGDEQAELGDNFQSFLNTPLIASGDVDFHIGVTTTDTYSRNGALYGSPRIITPQTPNLAAEFAQNARVGTSGSGDEMGLEAMMLALSEPMLSTTNVGFLREGAALAIIVVTDEEDSSPLTVAEYIAFAQDLKGAGFEELVNISGVRDPSSATRYDQAIAACNGTALDITAVGWGQQLGALGDAIFALPQIVTLDAEPSAATLTATVDGAPVTSFAIDEENHLLSLDQLPQPGSIVEVSYVPVCGP